MNGSAYKPHANTAVAQGWRLERFKIGFQYVLVLLASAVMGWLLAKSDDIQIEQAQMELILGHFFRPFASLPSARQALLTVLSFAASTLLGVALVFLFSFSAINCLINNGILIYFGARTGYTVSLLLQVVMQSDRIGFGRWILFFSFKLATMLLLLFCAYRTSEYSCYMRMNSSSGRALFHPRTVLSLCACTVWTASLVIGLHALYAWILAIAS